MARKARLSNRERETALTHATFDWGKVQSNGSTKVPDTLSSATVLEAQQVLKDIGMTSKDVLLIEHVLLRMAKKKRTQGSSLSEEEILQKLAKRLIKGTTSEIISFLKETEDHHLYFDDLDQLLYLFSWIQKKTEEELGQQDVRRQGRRSGRVIKDDYFWKNAHSMSCHLFGFFQNHWECFSTENGAVPIQSAQIIIRAFEIVYKLMSNVPPCKIVHLVKIAHQAGIELQQIERLALTHIPMRIDDFIQLITDKILTHKTCHLFLNNPELIRALSYEGIRHLFTRWKDSGGKTNILVFAQCIRHELYPDILPDGKEIDWEILEHPQLISFLSAVNSAKQSEGPFYFPDHAYAPGLYKPLNALVLLPHPIVLSSPKEKILLEEDEKRESFCEDALAAWMQRGELYSCLLDDPYLFTSTEEQAPAQPIALNPWDDVLCLIKEDICSQAESSLPEDPDLLALNQELEEVGTLLHLVSLGDTEGVLDHWSSWINTIRERIKTLDERLIQQAVLTTEPTEALEETPAQETPRLKTRKTSPRVKAQIRVEEQQAKKAPELPEREVKTWIQETDEKLKQLPSGAMRRQFKNQLDTLTNEALTDEKDPSLKARLMKLQAEIQSLLDEILS
jgi:hypothetical protein